VRIEMDAGWGFERGMNRGEPADGAVSDHDVHMPDDAKSHRTMMRRPRLPATIRAAKTLDRGVERHQEIALSLQQVSRDG
jgi:hypothetical protein